MCVQSKRIPRNPSEKEWLELHFPTFGVARQAMQLAIDAVSRENLPGQNHLLINLRRELDRLTEAERTEQRYREMLVSTQTDSTFS
ncbi:hypothetical protein pipiens_006749 [Culex pipiens pipiens]|uniref:Uncharacterized protein n=1 Tax=Culex pipiens pipiens TaxID=38569 RepID=A0ABD1DNS9_CULPP